MGPHPQHLPNPLEEAELRRRWRRLAVHEVMQLAELLGDGGVEPGDAAGVHGSKVRHELHVTP